MADTTFIYALVDPVTHAVRYVGKADDWYQRWRQHCAIDGNPNSHKNRWIRKVLAREIEPFPFPYIIEECPKSEWQERERYWIAEYRRRGHKLTNATSGGDGAMDLSPEAKRRWKKSMDRVRADPAYGQKLSEAHRNWYLNADPAEIAGIGAAISAAKSTPEARATISAAAKTYWTDHVVSSEERVRMGDRTREYFADEDNRGRHRAACVVRWSDPDERGRLSKTNSTPEARARSAAAGREFWSDPENYVRAQAAIKKARSTPEAREKTSEHSRSVWAAPGVKAKRVAAAKERGADPEFRAKMSAVNKANWSNPSHRERQSAGLKKAFAKWTPEQHAERCQKAWATRRANAAKRAAEAENG